jgi:hypothetical protein
MVSLIQTDNALSHLAGYVTKRQTSRDTYEESRKPFRFSEAGRKEKRDGTSIPQMGKSGLE